MKRTNLIKSTVKKLALCSMLLALTCCGGPSGGSHATPAENGEAIAKQYNESDVNLHKDIEKIIKNFKQTFNPSSYSSRTAAKQAFIALIEKRTEEYLNEYAEIDAADRQRRAEYSAEPEKLDDYEESFESVRRVPTNDPIPNMESIPNDVLTVIRNVIPVKPDHEQIMEDLVGRDLAEGVPDADRYFSNSWRFTIDHKEDISDFEVENIKENNDKTYKIEASMILTDGYIRFDTKALICYTLPLNDDWRLDYIQSRGMEVLPEPEYRDYITTKTYKYFGDDVFKIENTTDMSLFVFYDGIHRYSRKVRECIRLNPYQEYDTNCTDIKINCVTRAL